MKHSSIILLGLVLLSMTGLKASAHDIAVPNSDGVTIYYNYSGTQNLTVTFRGSSASEYSNEYAGNVVIPSSVTYGGKTYRVTGIGDTAFFNCVQLTSVTIPNSVTTIGILAFNFCEALTSIVVPNSVTTIGIHAFDYCSSLISVTLPSNLRTIGEGWFYGCGNLSSIELPSSILSIGNSAFYGCRSLVSITLPDNLGSSDISSDTAFV